MKKQREKSDSIDCAEAVSRFNDFMDNYLKGNSREQLVRHMSECRHCFERFEFEQMLKSKLKGIPVANRNHQLIEKIENMIASL
jgi:anti-sigma factor (TIGR02949 family)